MVTIAIRTLIIYIALSVVLRILGKRQIGELEISELVSTLLLSELATAAITDTDLPLSYSLLPLLLIMGFELLISDVKNRAPALKRIFEGSPGVIVRRGVLDQKELARLRISLEELLSAFRLQGVSTIEDVYYAILEQNGQLSLILKKEKQPPTIEDLQTKGTEETGIAHALVIDGQIKKEELTFCDKDASWVEAVCRAYGARVADVFLLSLDDAGGLSIILKDEKTKKRGAKG
ncbi:MAG: DUF421 domain-containing protein [Clostridia bacterium]|nr:DUF421 domain-containing protein [Clostridia bacterium]